MKCNPIRSGDSEEEDPRLIHSFTLAHSLTHSLTHSPGCMTSPPRSPGDFLHDMTSVDLQYGVEPSFASPCGCGSSKFTLKSPPT